MQNSERTFQICAFRFNFLHAALRCGSSRFKMLICPRLNSCTSFVADIFCIIIMFSAVLEDSVFYCELINLNAV